MAPTVVVLFATYVFGGLTFIPLALFVAFLLLPKPITDDGPHNADPFEKEKYNGGASEHPTTEKDGLEAPPSLEGSDVAAGHFEVCREFKPVGNTRSPLERIDTSSGSTPETPSMYRTMYKSIFERPKGTNLVESDRQKQKRSRNIFFIVMRYGGRSSLCKRC